MFSKIEHRVWWQTDGCSWRTILGSPLSRGWQIQRKDSIRLSAVYQLWNAHILEISLQSLLSVSRSQLRTNLIVLCLDCFSIHHHTWCTSFELTIKRNLIDDYSMTHTRKDFKCYPTTAHYSTIEACVDWIRMRVKDSAAAEVLHFTAGHGVLLSERPSYI